MEFNQVIINKFVCVLIFMYSSFKLIATKTL